MRKLCSGVCQAYQLPAPRLAKPDCTGVNILIINKTLTQTLTNKPWKYSRIMSLDLSIRHESDHNADMSHRGMMFRCFQFGSEQQFGSGSCKVVAEGKVLICSYSCQTKSLILTKPQRKEESSDFRSHTAESLCHCTDALTRITLCTYKRNSCICKCR